MHICSYKYTYTHTYIYVHILIHTQTYTHTLADQGTENGRERIPFEGMILAGWREEIVKARIENFLNGKNASIDALSIEQIFSNISQKDIEMIKTIKEEVQLKTAHSLKNVLIEISKLSGMLASPVLNGPIRERNIYIALYTILQMYPNPGNSSESMNSMMNGEPSYVSSTLKLYNDLIDSELTQDDFTSMGIDKKVSKECALESTTLSIRQTFGSLL